MNARARALSVCFVSQRLCTPSQVSGIRKERDPLDKLKRITMELGFMTEAEIKAMEKEVSLSSPLPPPN